MWVREGDISTLCWQPPPCPSLPFTSPKVANKGDLSCAASAPPLLQPGCPPHQSIPCQENEPTPVLNGTLCVHGRTGLTLHHGTKVGVKNIHGTAAPDLPSPPLSLFPLFYSSALPRATEGVQSARPQRKQKHRAKCSGTRRADLALTTLSDYLPTLPTTQHPPTTTHPPLIHTPPPLPSHLPPLPPPTCQTLLDIQKRKQESCCLPGKCCLHILRFKNYASQQKQRMVEASGGGRVGGGGVSEEKKKKKGSARSSAIIHGGHPPLLSSSSFTSVAPPPLSPGVAPLGLALLVRGRGFAEQALTKPPAASSSVHAF